ncbi:unnamed protein product [Merluccius merluccius]
MDSSLTKETEKTCVLCCQDVDIFALGKCDHPVCYRCSTKMRVLCEQKYCAVCREELDKVVFVKRLAAFSTLPFQQFHCEQSHDIYFSDAKIHTRFRRLLLPECPHCPEPKIFSRFEELEQHVRKQHELFCCKLCTKHLKIFSHERKWYNRKELARHRAHGDPDDTSHRGHPLCKFCDDRYLDNDELLKHLRRDHYFCHFCDADGAQEYYCDYQYLSEHFRQSHYLCEEGGCATEQFTHAFRSEIDYKAHKASAHSKNRAEARQNRQIDLQFTYAPRSHRRNDGMLTGEDYEESRRGGRGGGRPYGGQQKSWRYNRDEEERDIAAAMRASMAVRRSEERGPPAQDQLQSKKLASQTKNQKRNRKASRKQTNFVTEKEPETPRGLLKEDFPSLSAATPRGTLKEDDFPSLSATASVVTTPMTPAYTAPPRNSSSFQEEDFPALVSKLWPKKPSGGSATAWSSHAKPTSASRGNHGPPPASAFHAPVPPVPLTGPQPLSSSSSMAKSSRRKMRGGENAQPAPAPLRSSSDEEDGGLTQREFRAVPTMLDISSLLTVKSGNGVGGGGVSTGGSVGGRAQAPPGSSDMTPVPTASKASKKKKTQQQQQQPQQKNTLLPTTSSKLAASAKTKATTVAQKENVPEQSKNKPSPAPVATVTTVRAGTPSEMTNGYLEMALPPVTKKVSAAPAATSHPFPEPPPRDEEDFPALVTKKPPPGFKSSFPLKATAPPPAAPSSAVPPPPPPGLASAPSKPPPPGFTGIPLNSNVVEPTPPPLNRPAQLPDSYMVPENFQQRNLELIQSIRNYLHNDESHFNQFKNYSGQFRQGVMSAAQYYRSCKELLGDNFQCIFNELLVLLPDTSRQQELLAAHGDSRALEKQSGGGSKKNKSKRNVWQTTPAANSNAAALAELDCQVCPTCRQVLAPKDFNSHKTLHLGENEDFPSLQSISRIIS